MNHEPITHRAHGPALAADKGARTVPMDMAMSSGENLFPQPAQARARKGLQEEVLLSGAWTGIGTNQAEWWGSVCRLPGAEGDVVHLGKEKNSESPGHPLCRSLGGPAVGGAKETAV